MQDREQRIRDLAYRLWIQEGRPDGRAQQHWDLAADMIDADGGRLRAIHPAAPADVALSAVAWAEGKGAPEETTKAKPARAKAAKVKSGGDAATVKAPKADKKASKPAKRGKGNKPEKSTRGEKA